MKTKTSFIFFAILFIFAGLVPCQQDFTIHTLPILEKHHQLTGEINILLK